MVGKGLHENRTYRCRRDATDDESNVKVLNNLQLDYFGNQRFARGGESTKDPIVLSALQQ